MSFAFTLQHVEQKTRARQGLLQTPHGRVETPAFMPVGTAGTVKGLTPDQVRSSGAQMVLANTYHLTLRPGVETVSNLGGLHQFMGWGGPILTDSGGFQVYSLAERTRIDDAGAHFRSHIDGAAMTLTPESAIATQEQLGADIAMVLDHVVALPSEIAVVRDAMQRSLDWARRSQAAAQRHDQAVFAIVQGGLDEGLRIASAEALVALDFAGYAIGGLSVGEPPDAMYATLDFTVPVLPLERPRYLMGVGRPADLLEAIARGIDLFDCVMPTRNGRNGLAFTDSGPLRLRNRCHAADERSLEQDCPCVACQHSRGYLNHLFKAGEMLGPILLSIHNLTYYQRLLAGARASIAEQRFGDYRARRLAGWLRNDEAARL